MTDGHLYATVAGIVAELDPDSSLRRGADDISFAQTGVDSFRTIRLVLSLVVEFDIRLDPAEICRVSGLRELADLVGRRVADGRLAQPVR